MTRESHGAERIKLELSFDYFQPSVWKAWLLVGSGIWMTLGSAWLWFAFSYFFDFEVQAAGSVLVGAAVVSELILMNARWGKLRAFSPVSHFRLGISALSGDKYFFTEGFKIPADKQTLSLFAISDTVEELWRQREDCWRAHKTAARVTATIAKVIGASAIFGTLVWGYFHRL